MGLRAWIQRYCPELWRNDPSESMGELAQNSVHLPLPALLVPLNGSRSICRPPHEHGAGVILDWSFLRLIRVRQMHILWAGPDRHLGENLL